MNLIIDINNKQYFIEKNKIIYLYNVNYKIDDLIEFNKILLVYNKDKLLLGFPYIKNIKVIGLVIDSFKDKKIKIIKFKRRKNYLRKYGYRKLVTKLKIINININ